MRVGSLFTGIGGFDLGLERAGMQVVWQCESNEFCRRVLARHWPEVPCYEDVAAVTADAPSVDLVCGGFPCQPFSSAGARLGAADERWLWPEFARVIGELRPRYALMENVSGLLARAGGMGDLLGDLAALGYDAEWDCVPASAVGAPHQRDRVWIIGYPHDQGEPTRAVDAEASWLSDVGDTNSSPSDPYAETGEQRYPVGKSTWWEAEPGVGRVVNGLPAQMDRLSALGNALVPQIAEWIGRRLMEAEARGDVAA